MTRIANSTQLNGKNLLNTAATMTFQVGSNTGVENQIDISLGDLQATTLGVDKGSIAISGDDATNKTNFEAAVDAIDAALTTINSNRADLGAAQNRLTSTISNLQNINENASAALGRVQDTDFAAETAQLTKQQTLQQASTAILAQANQLPSAVLKLLQ
jgi:flagellin